MLGDAYISPPFQEHPDFYDDFGQEGEEVEVEEDKNNDDEVSL